MLKRKRNIRILLTDVNHPVTPSVTLLLKKNNDYRITIIGVESSGQKFGKLWTDKVYRVADPASEQYVHDVLSIVEKEHVDIVIPWTNIEAVALSKYITSFEKLTAKLLCNPYTTMSTVTDKGTLYLALKDSGIPLPAFYLVDSKNDIIKACQSLGYPERKVILKPRNLSGGRGQFILDSSADFFHSLESKIISLDALLIMLSGLPDAQNQPLDYIAMEYLEGEDYSVDTLSDKGNPQYIIMRKRLADVGGVSAISETTDNPKIRSLVTQILTFFAISYNCNLQFRYRKGQEGDPYLYDLNPRISGTIIANALAGIDLLTLAIYNALSLPYAKASYPTYKKMRMVRCWKEFVEYSNEEIPS